MFITGIHIGSPQVHLHVYKIFILRVDEIFPNARLRY